MNIFTKTITKNHGKIILRIVSLTSPKIVISNFIFSFQINPNQEKVRFFI